MSSVPESLGQVGEPGAVGLDDEEDDPAARSFSILVVVVDMATTKVVSISRSNRAVGMASDRPASGSPTGFRISMPTAVRPVSVRWSLMAKPRLRTRA
ncbi:hypothetical protein OG609_37115 [Streptomyces sp. NBC_01224]|nr:hypothetical protein OG609_37115 [Streptomyces sp. NBC_01224]